MIKEQADNKRFTKVFANDNSVIFFCPLSPLYFKPALVPSKGCSELTFFGNGFVDTGLQVVRFTLQEEQLECDLSFDPKTSTFFVQTPTFEKVSRKLSYPFCCKVELSLDRKELFAYPKPLLIYCKLPPT